jgi:hypothetical protein
VRASPTSQPAQRFTSCGNSKGAAANFLWITLTFHVKPQALTPRPKCVKAVQVRESRETSDCLGRSRGTIALLAALLADVEAGEVKERAALIDAFKPIQALRQTAQDCARGAANYVHPKLANLQHGSDPDNPLNAVTDADRAQVILAVLAENPKLLDHILKQLT